MKNWDPLVFLPALAMDKIPGLLCLSLKFSSMKPCQGRENAGRKAVQTFEFFTINGFAASAVSFREITTLKHEVGDDTVEFGSLVAITIGASG